MDALNFPSLRAILPLIFALTLALVSSPAQSQTVVIQAKPFLDSPNFDGQLDEWEGRMKAVPMHPSKIGSNVGVERVEMGAAYDDEFIYLAFRWPDSTLDTQHMPYIWDQMTERYVVSHQREDGLAIQFEKSGNFDTNWLSGKEFVADLWHWKSARTAPLNLAEDGKLKISREKLTRAFKATTPDGAPVFIQRRVDQGQPLYKNKRYGLKESMQMPKYLLNSEASGSSTDVMARSSWRKGVWNLELKRRLDTGHDDDRPFQVGDELRIGLAVFNRSMEDDHAISNIIRLKLTDGSESAP